MSVTKIGHVVPVSCCVLTDSTGVNHCNHPAPVISRRRRIRWALTSWWWRNRPVLHRGPCNNHEDD